MYSFFSQEKTKIKISITAFMENEIDQQYI